MNTCIIPVRKNENIVFVPQSINYFLANDSTVELVKRIDEDYEDIKCAFPGLTEEIYYELKNKINEVNKNRRLSYPETQLDRLIINISNDCNMRCKYCYANQGTYGGTKNMMEIECLQKVLHTFFDIFDTIGLIQLFGGEPTMNLKAIEYAGAYIKDHGYSTELGLVTNGTNITEHFMAIVNAYKIKVTVSVDVEKTHDCLRPFPQDAPSWNLIKNNIHKLQRYTGEPSQIEFTYTKVHEDNDLSISKILRELQSEYGNIPVHIAPVCSEDIRYHLPTREVFTKSVQDIYDLKEHGEKLTYSTLKSIELSLKHKMPFDFFCGAGISTLAIAVHGDIYPCFYFIDNDNFKIANIYDIKTDIKQAILDKRNALLHHPKESNVKCSNCFAKAVCTGCLGANYTDTGDPFLPCKDHCEMTKSMVEAILKKQL